MLSQCVAVRPVLPVLMLQARRVVAGTELQHDGPRSVVAATRLVFG